MLFLLLIVLFFIIFGLIMGLEWAKNSWYSIISTTIAILTFGLLYIQHKNSKLLQKLTITPSYFFTLKSSKTYLGEEKWRGLSKEEKSKTYLLIRNYSNFPVLFGIKITFSVIGDSGIAPHIDDHYYKNPLHIMPGSFARYPEVIHLERITQKIGKNIEELGDKKILAHVETFCNPHQILKPKYGIRSEDWTFDSMEFVWKDPQGTKDKFIVIS